SSTRTETPERRSPDRPEASETISKVPDQTPTRPTASLSRPTGEGQGDAASQNPRPESSSQPEARTSPSPQCSGGEGRGEEAHRTQVENRAPSFTEKLTAF